MANPFRLILLLATITIHCLLVSPTTAQVYENLTDSMDLVPDPVQMNFNDEPYVLILPGVLGEQIWDRNLKKGIEGSGFHGDVEIFDWTLGPLMFGLNIGGSESNTQYLSQRIVEFKNQNPLRPIYLVGHSGGCRMVVSVLESLPAETMVERSLLLSPCMEANYNLSAALNSCRSGMIAFRAPADIPVSVPLTTLHGLTKGRLSVPASVIGFKIPRNADAAQVAAYNGFSQVNFSTDMMSAGHAGGHFGWTMPRFAAQYLAPLLSNSY